MQSTAHARHNIFSAEPINNEKKKASRKDVKRVSFVDSMPTTPSTPQDSPPQHIGKLTKSPSNMSSSLPDIDFDVRKKLAVKDLSVKFVHKSPTFNVATTMGVKSPSTKLQSTEDRVNNILNDMFALDDDADLNSISKASLASMHSQGVASQGPPPSQPSQRSTAAGKPTFSSSQSLSYSHTAKSNKYSVKIMPNSYFFGDNHSVVEVDDDDYESTGMRHIYSPHSDESVLMVLVYSV